MKQQLRDVIIKQKQQTENMTYPWLYIYHILMYSNNRLNAKRSFCFRFIAFLSGEVNYRNQRMWPFITRQAGVIKLNISRTDCQENASTLMQLLFLIKWLFSLITYKVGNSMKAKSRCTYKHNHTKRQFILQNNADVEISCNTVMPICCMLSDKQYLWLRGPGVTSNRFCDSRNPVTARSYQLNKRMVIFCKLNSARPVVILVAGL